MKTFSGGVHPPTNKESSLVNAIKQAKIPPFVIIPLAQHIGAPAEPLVSVGDTVKAGTKVGEAKGFISSNVHASISGTVAKIDLFPHPTFGHALAVKIESDGKDDRVPLFEKQEQRGDLSAEEIVALVKEAGVVGLGGAAFPTHVKLSPPPSKKIDTIIINGVECEPFLTCDHMLMLSKPTEIIKGIQLIMKAVGAGQCYIGIERNKMEALEVLYSKIRGLNIGNIKPIPLKVKYPQGAEKQLISAILDREVPCGGLPMDVGVVVQNVATAFAIYEAVYFHKPLYERIITIGGSCTVTSQNIIARMGTSFAHLFKEVGGIINPPLKIIMGGPMMGIAQENIENPVVKATSGIFTIYPEEMRMPRTRPCIRCGRCVTICPMGLMPSSITLAGESERYERSKELGVLNCIECGACAYVCPAKRPMVHSIKIIKNEIFKQERKTKE